MFELSEWESIEFVKVEGRGGGCARQNTTELSTFADMQCKTRIEIVFFARTIKNSFKLDLKN